MTGHRLAAPVLLSLAPRGAALKDASRRQAGGPGEEAEAILDRAFARRQDDLRPGRENSASAEPENDGKRKPFPDNSRAT